jgi:hypothetical protein
MGNGKIVRRLTTWPTRGTLPLSLARPTTYATMLILAGLLAWPWVGVLVALSSLGGIPRGADSGVHRAARPAHDPSDLPTDPAAVSTLSAIEDLDDGDDARELPASPLGLFLSDSSAWSVAAARPIPPACALPATLILATHRFRC